MDIEYETEALYQAIQSKDHQRYVSANQVGALAGLVRQGLSDQSRENRLAVMRLLIGEAVYDALGVDFQSFKNLSASIATLLIDLWLVPETKPFRLNAYGRELIAAAEAAVKAQAAA